MVASEEQYTRCPSCRTVFRATPAQLALRGGQVRCGHCRTVFDGNAQRISLSPAPRGESEPHADELALGPPTVTLRSARALEVPAAAEPPFAREPSFGPGVTVAAEEARSASGRAIAAEAPASRTGVARVLTALAVPVLALLLVAQALVHFRDALAARWPAVRPVLVRMCAATGCAIRPPRDVTGLAIDGSDLQADPAHRGLLILTATLRNRGPTVLEYPHLELSLTDSSDRVVVRRALAPQEYAGGATDLQRGIPANGEVLVKLFIDASATTQAGYRLYLFYP
jgi:predicted Zn finger-like uncharacterized protein